jgi:hypothetical protein
VSCYGTLWIIRCWYDIWLIAKVVDMNIYGLLGVLMHRLLNIVVNTHMDYWLILCVLMDY